LVRASWLIVGTLCLAVPVRVRAEDRAGGAGSGSGIAAQDTIRRTRPDSAAADSARARRDTLPARTTQGDSASRSAIPFLPIDSTLDVRLTARLEAKGERVRDVRCSARSQFGSSFGCGGALQPIFDFQFNLRSAGTLADRIHVDVDYDTQREFDASNAISIFYEGKPSSLFQRVEIGNVSFAPPTSRFITAGLPSGNYGFQALGRAGPMRFGAIAAQQKGNVVQDRVFVIGDRARQTADRTIEDFQIEPRRFFWTVDPRRFGSRYPNIDILDAPALRSLAASLPDSVRPSRIFLYRLVLGAQPANPNGPRFTVWRGDPVAAPGCVAMMPGAFPGCGSAGGAATSSMSGGGPPVARSAAGRPGTESQDPDPTAAAPPYELLREGIDYYVDPSNLWFALVRPLSLTNERLVIAYTVRVGGRDTVVVSTGGTPDLQYIPGKTQVADLVWDPRVTPEEGAFLREIRSVYRLGGEEIARASVDVRIVTGASNEQEKPAGTSFDSYLQLFGLARRTDPSRFDVENRLWPRPGDPNLLTAGGVGGGALGAPLIRDRFIVFPSVEPFARAGLARDPNIPANDSLYRTPNEYLYGPQHPQSAYRIRARYESEGSGGDRAIALNAVQIRQGSDRVTIDGRPLRRGIDYDIDYEVGRIVFRRPDTLFAQPRRVSVRYEENPLFQSIPTTIFGFTSTFAADAGELSFTAISQTQRSTFTRPPLGYEPASSLVAGVSGAFAWDAPALTTGLSRLLAYRHDSVGPSRIAIQGEFAMSRPQLGATQQAFLESFEGEGGLSVNLSDAAWYFSSQPVMTSAVASRAGAGAFDLDRATTLAWQNTGTDRAGRQVAFSIEQIDPQTDLGGGIFSGPETMLWLTLYPLAIGGRWDPTTRTYDWRVGSAPRGRRWRSVRTPLGQAGQGADLTRVETIDFWTLVDTSATRRGANPTLVLDFGDISENSVAFGPDTLIAGPAPRDSTFGGKKLQGLDRIDSERDPFSRAFDVARDDHGLPGDVVDAITVIEGGVARRVDSLRICTRGLDVRALGDTRADCTVGNNRLDEEDLDLDGVLNLSSADRDRERVRRYVVDLSDPREIDRVGRCNVRVDDVNGALGGAPSLCWVHVRVPFARADDSTNGGPLLRKVLAMRVSMLSGQLAPDDAFLALPLARLRLVGAPWLKRTERPARGVGGDVQETGGFVIASVIGTQDSTASLSYQSPPGVVDAPDVRQQQPGSPRVVINERSLRMLAGGLQPYDRAEAYFRFPEGERSFMAYRELRAWARGRGRGWGPSGELQFYIKIGRDANNFYLYRTSANGGNARSAWEPEVRVRFDRFLALRARLQSAYLRAGQKGAGGAAVDSLACAGVDSALIVRSGLPFGAAPHRYAACEGGYMVYTVDPTTSPPNLAAVQELAVGIVRVDSVGGPTPLTPADTAEVWVDDIRLADAVSDAGFAGQIGATVQLGDVGAVRVNLVRRDPNFRQLGEQPSFVTSNDLEVAASWRLDRLLPARLGVALPLTITHVASGADPQFVTRSDIPAEDIVGLRTPRTSLTTYSLTVRRATPLEGPWWAPIANHLALSGAYTSNGERSEFQTGSGRRFSAGFDFVNERALYAEPSVSPPRDTLPEARPSLPMALLERVLGAFTTFNVSSALAGDDDRRTTFLKPAAAVDDTAREVHGLSRLWRSGSVVELRPTPAVGMRLEASSLRDLRDYGDTSVIARAASDDRSRLLGADLGLERERVMRLGVTIAPSVTPWLVPRLDLSAGSHTLRDVDAPTLVPAIDTLGAPAAAELPRRLNGEQTITAAVALDLVRALGGVLLARDSGLTASLARVVQPVQVSWTRGLLGAFDATAASPSLGWQLGLADVGGFRRIDGRPASSAGRSSQLTVTHTFALPFGVSITNRMQQLDTRTWTRQLDGGQLAIDGEQVTWPDVALQWIARPGWLAGVVSSVAVNARWLETRQGSVIPTALVGVPDEERSTRVRSWPLGATVAWTPGHVSTSASYTLTRRADSLPGSLGATTSHDASAEIAKAFALPASWGMKSALRTRVSYQDTRTASFVSNLAAVGERSRLTDNGRQAFTANAATDLADNLTFSLQGSRVVSFDRNFNRELVQTVFSAALQLEFFGGAMR
jgi:hypothetical protein